MRANCKNIKFKVLSVEILRLENNFTDVKSMSGPFKETLNELFIIHLSMPDSSSIHMFPGIRILLPVPGVSCSHVHPSLCTLKLFSHLYPSFCILFSLFGAFQLTMASCSFYPFLINKRMKNKTQVSFILSLSGERTCNFSYICFLP